MPFVKLDTGILDSSLWSEPSSTRICWITLLAMADGTGLVRATAPGIANRANLGVDETRKALEVFEAPDENSRSTNDDGRKIRRVDGGYEIINYMKYREIDYTAAERMRRFRALRRNERNQPNKTVTLRKQKQIAEAEVLIPSGLDTDGFRCAWKDWVQHRKEIKHPLTPTSIKQQLKHLSEIGELRAVCAIRYTIRKGWQGLVEENENGRVGQNGQTVSKTKYGLPLPKGCTIRRDGEVLDNGGRVMDINQVRRAIQLESGRVVG